VEGGQTKKFIVRGDEGKIVFCSIVVKGGFIEKNAIRICIGGLRLRSCRTPQLIQQQGVITRREKKVLRKRESVHW